LNLVIICENVVNFFKGPDRSFQIMASV